MEASLDLRCWVPEHATADRAALRTPEPRPKRVGTTRVVLDEELNPFERLSAGARKRLLVRVLCELVAYDTGDPVRDRLAG